MSDELISFKQSSGHYINLQLNVPNECPYCHQGILPEIACQTEHNEQLNLNVGILFKCPKCKKFFAREYSVINSFNHSISGKKTTPVLYPAFPNCVTRMAANLDINRFCPCYKC